MSLAKTPGRKDQRLFTILNYSVPVCLFFAPSLCLSPRRQDAKIRDYLLFLLFRSCLSFLCTFATLRDLCLSPRRQDAKIRDYLLFLIIPFLFVFSLHLRAKIRDYLLFLLFRSCLSFLCTFAALRDLCLSPRRQDAKIKGCLQFW